MFERFLLQADRSKIVIVLRNLLSNALKFTSKSDITKVHIKVSVLSRGGFTQVKSDSFK
jgi:signal transduction histidine kinase